MERLHISIEINGQQHPVGQICGSNYRDARFIYAPEYLELDDILPISVHLPLQEESFSAEVTAAYFEGLLPEGFSRRAVANWAKSDEKNYLRILHRLGQECLGAIQVIGEGQEPPGGSYQRLSEEQVKALAAEGATKSTQLLMETHLSLTGASGKVGLYYDKENDAWYLPIGNSASTHIVKQSHIRLDQIVLNEQICMRAAKYCGIDVPDSFIINLNDGKDEDILYATERYDRKISQTKSLDGLALPYRLHQEDFCQALGISAGDKYEIEKSGYLKKMFHLLRTHSTNPMEDLPKLWDMVVYNYLIGNTDCHLKNYSLLYNEELTGIRLAPAYDIICTQAYHSTKDMSFFIGNEVNIDKITRACFKDAAKEIGIGEKMAMKRFDALANRFESSLKLACEEMKEKGFVNAGEFEQRILKNSGYAKM